MKDPIYILQMFVIAGCSSLLIDVFNVFNDRTSADRGWAENISAINARYKSPIFWIVRLLVSMLAGGVALTFEVHSFFQAAYIGATVPMFLQTFAKGTVSIKNSN